jgi:hypothetical protein
MNSPPILSKAAFAARHGIARSTISKWISRGQLKPPALRADGRIDVAAAERQLRALLDPARSTAINGGGDDAAGLIKRQREQRIERGEIDLRRARAEERERRGEYVRAVDVARERGRFWQQFLQTLENWLLSDMPHQLALDPDARAALRKSWRRFRERESDAAQQRADTMPPFIDDDEERE